MSQTFVAHSAEETKKIGKKIALELKPGTTLCLTGDLGSGKTTFAQGLLEGLGAERPYISPTFILMKQYDLRTPSSTGIHRVYHADAYRIDGPEDFKKLGFDEWCSDPRGLVILEWPERIQSILPEKTLNVNITAVSDTERNIAVKLP